MASQRLRALIADDEPIARLVLREELATHPDVEIVGEAASGQSTLDQIAELHPDIVFLDLQMPGMGGFEVIQRMPIGAHVPVVIIVTAFDQYAIQALDAGAIDYLLKPVRQSRLTQAIERARQLVRNPARAAENAAQLQETTTPPGIAPVRKIVGRLGAEFFLLNPADVLAFEADGELVWIITAKQRYLATERLRTIQEKLVNTSFERVHRGVLVNVDHVKKMAPLSSNRWLITLCNSQEFIVSKRLARGVRQILSW